VRRDRALARGVGALLLLAAHHAAVEYRPAFALWALGRPPAWAFAPAAALLALHALALAMLLSRWPRAAAAAACAVVAALYAAVPATYHNNHYLLFVLVLLTALAPTDPAAPLGLARVVRWQVALVYLSSVAVKLAHPWWRGSGTVIRWLATTRAPEANPDALLYRLLSPLLSRPLPSRLADLAVTALEVAVPLGLMSPRTRGAAAVAGVALHLSMQEWLFPQLFTFLMLLSYFAWSPADDRSWSLRLPDDARLARALDALDLMGRVAVSTDASAPAWRLTGPDGRRFDGPGAALRFALLTPWTVIAYATAALLFPELRAVGPVARDAVENVVVAALVVALGAAMLNARGPQLPGRKTSHPE
ncbi:MAG: Vitamin K-dependent gamma-carboxylase, partial [Myxococcaceae bacterium]|nr:Vitamin K-dependent gamma-carboxylase [Myxococcaceae bacterium]